MKDIIFYLRNIPLFEELEEEILGELSKAIIERKYEKNSKIYLQGDRSEGIYIIKNGQVIITMISEEGGEKILYLLGPGEIFGEIAIFDGKDRANTAQALTDCEIILIPSVKLESFLKSNPEIAIKLLKVISYRLRLSQMEIRDLALQDTVGRTIGTLLQLAKEHGCKSSEGTEINLPINRQALASMIGTSRETLTRILFKLQEEKIIALNKKTIIILDEERLADCI